LGEIYDSPFRPATLDTRTYPSIAAMISFHRVEISWRGAPCVTAPLRPEYRVGRGSRCRTRLRRPSTRVFADARTALRGDRRAQRERHLRGDRSA
jgi:hypothetical protein